MLIGLNYSKYADQANNHNTSMLYEYNKLAFQGTKTYTFRHPKRNGSQEVIEEYEEHRSSGIKTNGLFEENIMPPTRNQKVHYTQNGSRLKLHCWAILK